MALASGSKLGPYELQNPLGAGGMGEVYRARDIRLDRTVAVKVLPESFASDAERLQRFEHEARLLSTFNHPNLLSIYDVGTQGAIHYLVSEFLEGQTLRERITGAPLAQRRVIEYAQQIVNGLSAAHEKGITHRDLKPDNIFITRGERVKILDFGLAKQTRAAAAFNVEGATLTSPDRTAAGVILGTVGYMSPEQVRGQAADHRSDIFSFGAILYEMVSRKRAFKADSSVETMNAIVNEEPPELADSNPQVSPGLDRIIRRCLEKAPERRFQSASDLAFALESLTGTSSIEHAVRGRARRQRAWLSWTVAMVGLALAAAAVWLIGASSAKQVLPKFTRLTYDRGYPSNARFARDGHTVLYSAQWNNEPLQIYSVRMDYPQSIKVDLPSAELLGLSADGEVELALQPIYHANFLSGTMAQARMEGGAPRGLENEVIAADFASDGKTLAVARHASGRVQLEYPPGKVIYETSGYVDHVRVSPNGQAVAFLEHPVYDDDRGWAAMVDDGGKHRKLTREFPATRGLAWAPTGKEIWFTASDITTDQQIFGVDLSGKLRQILTSPKRLRLLDIAADGRVLLSTEEYRAEITGIDPGTGKERSGLEWFNGSSVQDILPDGKAILVEEWGGVAGPLYDSVYRKLDGSAAVLLGPGAQSHFSPDGKMAAAILLTTPPQIVLHPIGTGESRQLSLGNIVAAHDVSWFPDGRHLLLVAATEGQALRTYQMDTIGGKPEAVGPADWRGVAVANDGIRIAGNKPSGDAIVFNEKTQKVQGVPGITAEDSLQKWTEDGKSLLVHSGTIAGAQVYRVDVATGKRTLLRTVQLNDKAGSVNKLRLLYADKSNTYVYGMRRIVGSLYVAEGLK